MTWFKADDKLHDGKKTRRALRTPAKRRDAAAMGLWILAGTWCAGNETDGFVPTDELDRWDDDAETLAGRLVDSGLWHPAELDGEPGFQFHDWPDYQWTREQLEVKRAQARERMARARGGAVRANKTRSDANPSRPDPTKKNTPAPAEPASFAAFWQACPRKIGRTAAVKAYTKALHDGTDADTILHGITVAAAEWQAARTEDRFIPHPSTWLNQGRWADEHQTLLSDRPTVRVTARQCATPDPHTRHPWDASGQPHMCLGVSD